MGLTWVLRPCQWHGGGGVFGMCVDAVSLAGLVGVGMGVDAVYLGGSTWVSMACLWGGLDMGVKAVSLVGEWWWGLACVSVPCLW